MAPPNARTAERAMHDHLSDVTKSNWCYASYHQFLPCTASLAWLEKRASKPPPIIPLLITTPRYNYQDVFDDQRHQFKKMSSIFWFQLRIFCSVVT